MTDNSTAGRHKRHHRTTLEKIKCALGFHDYGPPQVMRTALILSGERTDDGWEHDVNDDPEPDRRVVQHCRRPRCWGEKERPDLDPDEIRPLHTGREQP